MMKVLVGYPTDREELIVVQRTTTGLPTPRQIMSTEQLMEYAVRLVGATRRPADYGLGGFAHYITFGASPRASINLILGARALALTRGRDYVVPPDISELAPDVLRHRLVLSYEALADRVTADDIIRRILDSVPKPVRPLTDGPLRWNTEPVPSA
jgi:MoxR-like ATPase